MNPTQSILSIAVTLFFIANPIGNTPAILALIKNFSFEQQRKIMIREGLASLFLALFFQFFGEIFLQLIHIQDYTVSICGGVLLIIVAINMIFPPVMNAELEALQKEPFFVPIATPLLAGPSLLTIIMLLTHQDETIWRVSLAIVLAWVGIFSVLIFIPYMKKFLGNRGLVALEQLMGLTVSFIAIDMTLNGIRLFMAAN